MYVNNSRIDAFVLKPDADCDIDVSGGIGVKHLLEVPSRQLAHALGAAGKLHRFRLVKHQSPLGDILGQIADALKIAGDAPSGEHDAQIARHRLAQRKQANGAPLYVALGVVDLGIAPNDGLGEERIAAHDGLDAIVERALNQPAHALHFMLKRGQFLSVGFYRMFHKRRS
jgi:hypothetical protein